MSLLDTPKVPPVTYCYWHLAYLLRVSYVYLSKGTCSLIARKLCCSFALGFLRPQEGGFTSSKLGDTYGAVFGCRYNMPVEHGQASDRIAVPAIAGHLSHLLRTLYVPDDDISLVITYYQMPSVEHNGLVPSPFRSNDITNFSTFEAHYSCCPILQTKS